MVTYFYAGLCHDDRARARRDDIVRIPESSLPSAAKPAFFAESYLA
jgi:hypothetical protein